MSRIHGQFWGDSSGKVAGVVFGRGKGGKSLRARVKPTDAKSLAQQSVRSTFSNSVGTWNAITTQNKRAWNSFAASGFRTKHNKKNSIPSGFQAFSSVNFALSLGSSHRGVATFLPTTVNTTIGDLPSMNLNAPSKSLSGCLSDDDGKPIFISLDSASFDLGLERVTGNFNISPTISTPPLFWQDPLSGKKLSISMYCSKQIPDGQSSTGKSDAYYLGNTGLLSSADVSFDADSFTLNMTIEPTYLESIKNGFIVGSKVFISAYLVSEEGLMRRIGVVSSTISG